MTYKPPVTAKSALPLVRPVPSVLAAVIAALESAGELRASDIARATAGLPPRIPTADEQFMATVSALVTGGQPVGFNCDTTDTLEHCIELVRSMTPPAGRLYKVTRDSDVAARFEASLVLAP